MKILLTDEEIKGAIRALNNDMSPYFADISQGHQAIARAQLKKVVELARADDCFNEDYCDGSGDWCITFSKGLWQALLKEVE